MSSCGLLPFIAGDAYAETCQDVVVTVDEATEVKTYEVVPIPAGMTIACSVLDAAGVLHALEATIAVDRLSFTLFLASTAAWAHGIAKRDIKFVLDGITEHTNEDQFTVKGFITP